MGKKIFLSPSNQNNNSYAYGNTTEDVQCGKIAKALETALQRCGFETRLEQYDTIQNRVAHSDSWGADMHIAIHTNAFNGSVGGTRCFYYANNGYGNVATQCVYNELAPITLGTSDNITRNADLYEVYKPIATSVYVEAEFHDVVEYAKWIIEHTTDIAEAICKGVCKYYGYEYKPMPQPTPQPTPQPEIEYLEKKVAQLDKAVEEIMTVIEDLNNLIIKNQKDYKQTKEAIIKALK